MRQLRDRVCSCCTAVIGLVISLVFALPASAQVSVLTQHNDIYRSGTNLNETILNTSNVNVHKFGKLFTRHVDAEIYAQPLYVPHLLIPGKGIHNVVFVATMNNSVYAFDADDPNQSAPLWQDNFGPPVPASDVQCCCTDISVRVGILSTPVINPNTNLMYLVSRNKNPDGTYHQWLHALDITTGQERLNGPVEIKASYGNLTFDPKIQNQRPALLLYRGAVYISWASHNDCGPYHGWIVAYDASNLHQIATYCDTLNGTEGGIWQSGQGPTVGQDGNIYIMTGNGTFDANTGGPDLGCSFIKLSPAIPNQGGLKVLDWFTPYNVDSLNAADLDLGSSGVLVIPGTPYSLGGGKQGVFYLLNIHNLGHFNPSGDTQIVQSFQAGNGHIHGSPVYYNSPVNGPCIYVWSEEDYLKVFAFKGTYFNATPIAYSPNRVPDGMPGAMLSISANGQKPGTAIIWASHPYQGNANNAVVPGILQAFDANSISVDNQGIPRLKELWNSRMNANRDDIGKFAKFCCPTIANGKVYMASFGAPNDPIGAGQLVVYGLLDSVRPTAPSSLTASVGDQQLALSWTPVSNADSYNIYRGTAPGQETLYKQNVTQNYFTDIGLQDGIVYYYRVTAQNNGGESPPSNEVAASPQLGHGGTKTLSPIADAYTCAGIYANQNFGAAQNLKVSNDSPNDTCYTFLKFDLSGLSTPLSGALLTLFGSSQNGKATLVTARALSSNTWGERTITWNNMPSLLYPFANARIWPKDQYCHWDVSPYFLKQVAANSKQFSVALTPYRGLTDVMANFYSREAGVNPPFLTVCSPGGPPAAPTELAANADILKVSLQWDSIGGASSYSIYRATASGAETLYQTGLTSTTFSDTNVQANITYYYRVAAVNSFGQSALSNEASASPLPKILPDYPTGFSSAGNIVLNGGATFDDTRLQLTNSATYFEASSAFFKYLVDVRKFHNHFTFQIQNAQADGFTFTIQSDGPTAIGLAGGSLGYEGINNSVAIKFDLYNNSGEGTDSTGLYTNGAPPTVPAIDLTNTGIDLHSGHIFAVDMVYDGITLQVTIRDTQTSATATQSYQIDIPNTIGSPIGYVGFTGGTGGLTATQEILTWTYTVP
jgi:hypothetical protein